MGDGKFQGLQAERIDGRKDWCSYVELKTAIHRAHIAQIDAELHVIQEGLLRDASSRPESDRLTSVP